MMIVGIVCVAIITASLCSAFAPTNTFSRIASRSIIPTHKKTPSSVSTVTTQIRISSLTLSSNKKGEERNLDPDKKTTEQDVVIALEKAETLWSQAHQARIECNELAERATQLTTVATQSTQSASRPLDDILRKGNGEEKKINLSMIEDAKNAMNDSLDAGSGVERAAEADKKAEELEALAEAASEEMERVLEQHLIDFPDSELGKE